MKYKLEKLYAWIKWGTVIIFVDGIMRLLCILFYPLAYILRDGVRSWHYGENKIKFILSLPLWVLLNDGKSNDVGYKWFLDAKGIYPTNSWNRFRLAYLWNPMRNPCFNIYEYIHPNKGEKTDLDCPFHYFYNPITSLYYFAHNNFKDVFVSNVLKWKNAHGEASDNMGETIDYENAVLGKTLIYYRIDGVLYFRYSKAYISEEYSCFGYSFKIAREIQLGVNDRRFKIRNKIKLIKI